MTARASAPPRSPLTKQAIVARVALGLACLLVTSFFLSRLSAPGGGGLVGAKLEYYEGKAPEFDTVFLGSSHVYRAFVPSEFDTVMEEHGRSSSSFNFGVQLPHLLESRHLLQRILTAGDGHLKRVFFEYQTYTPQIDPQNAFIPRTIYWHDAEQTRVAVRQADHWHAELPDGLDFVEPGSGENSVFRHVARLFPADWRIGSEHVQHYAHRQLMVGRGKDVAKGVLGRSHGQTTRMNENRGYISLEAEQLRLLEAGQTQNPYQRRRADFLAELGEYARRVDALRTEEVYFGDDEWMNPDLTQVDDLEVLRLMAEDAREAGVEFVIVVMPANSCNRPVERRLASETEAMVMRFNLPDIFPRFYEVEMRFDSGHFSASGAVEFTRVFAQQYAQSDI